MIFEDVETLFREMGKDVQTLKNRVNSLESEVRELKSFIKHSQLHDDSRRPSPPDYHYGEV